MNDDKSKQLIFYATGFYLSCLQNPTPHTRTRIVPDQVYVLQSR